MWREPTLLRGDRCESVPVAHNSVSNWRKFQVTSCYLTRAARSVIGAEVLPHLVLGLASMALLRHYRSNENPRRR